MGQQYRVVVMGVSAVGKSTIGAALATALDVRFLDGDDYHSPASISKMASGTPLNDADREPWLRACGQALANEPGGAVLACSALTARYRALLRAEAPDVVFVHLAADIEGISQRASTRTGHFMPPDLLASQYALLEDLTDDENGFVVDADQEPAVIVERALVGLAS